MPPQIPEDDTSSLEKARERLYRPTAALAHEQASLSPEKRSLPHVWRENLLPSSLEGGHRHVRLSVLFFGAAAVFFFVALLITGSLFYFGGNSVSVDKISLDIQGPTSINGGDTVPFALTIANKNPVAIQDAIVEIDFPSGTRDATNVSLPYLHYIEKLGTIESGAVITRSIKAVMFGGVGQSIILPISFSYAAAGSNAVFAKKSTYALTVATTPLDLTVNTLTETVSNKPLTLTLTVRSNATVALTNVVVTGAFPFGFLPTSSSIPLTNSSFFLGTLTPGASKTITLTGTLTGQNNEPRVFHFSLGTANSPRDQTLAVTYMTQEASVIIAAPFIDTTLSLNGKTGDNTILTPGALQNVSISYTNTLSTSVENAIVQVALSGSGIDYDSIRTTSGFYNSANHTIIFSKDTDPSLATLAPSASGVGAFTFSTPASGALGPSPTVNFSISVSGTRVGQSNVPEEVTASITRTAKVMTTVALNSAAFHAGGPFANSGPIPPRADQATTYTVLWGVQNRGNAVAGGTLSTVLPSYVSYTGLTNGTGAFAYNEASRTVTWTIGDLAQGATAQGAFQVSLTPSTSQKGSAPLLTSSGAFSGYDRFAGVQITAQADPVTTETKGDPGYVSANAVVQ